MRAKLIGMTSIIVLIGMLISCKKDFLDKNPTAAISSEVFWKSDADAQMGLAGVYRRLQEGFFGHRKLWLDTYSDNALDRHSFYGFGNLTQGIVNPTNIPGAFYNAPYQGIASCNYFLENIDKAPSTEAAKNTYKAEVRFLRAMFYFDLVQAYGGVVLYKTNPKTVDEGKIAKSSKEEVLAFIHEDLDFAISNLQDVAYAGHAVKGSAQALKAKVYLSQQNWPQAAKFANDVMTGSGGFSIYQGGYEKLFLTTTQQNNPEIIFSTKFLAPNNPQGGEGVLVELGWYGSIAPYQNLVDEYEMANGKMIGETGSGYDGTNPYNNRDPRLKFTIKVPTEKYINPDGTVFNESDPLLTTYSQKKYVDLSKLPFDRSKTPLTDQNIIHLRFADVLLMYAEAKNEESGPNGAIYDAIDKIRTRTSVGLPPIDRTVYNTKEKLRDFILHERRVELALEGHRYFDLKRRNLMGPKLALLKNPAGVQLKFGELNNVLPFSQGELDRNKKLEQNPDYIK
ncbi:RagB/SusD family nutrient uptake outer membrane protein [Pedobacter frigoris]|uniref:RagB/SusD family nutrient uptake outer membrane protein n=1 Tax=Pedobacter frigoris TaxID=2571272 RepID=UPI00292E4B90|nr:RagB/SusD family nutrient uptake outer membrane protein [Pedobacter frigoris]